MGGRDPDQRPRLLRRLHPVVRLGLGRVLAAHPGQRLGQRAPGAAAAASHAHSPELQPDVGPGLLPVRAGGMAGLVVVVPPPAAGDRVVPGAVCPRRRGGGGRDGGGVGRHRGRPPAVDRLPRPAGQRRGHPGQRGPRHAGGDPRPVRDLDGGLDRRSDDHVTALAAGSARRRGGRAGAVRPFTGRGRGNTGRAPGTAGRATGIFWRAGGSMSPSPEAIAVAAILFVVIAAYALFGGADFGGGIWDLLAGRAERGARPPPPATSGPRGPRPPLSSPGSCSSPPAPTSARCSSSWRPASGGTRT